MRAFTYRITYLANGARRIEFSGSNPNGRCLTLVFAAVAPRPGIVLAPSPAENSSRQSRPRRSR